MLRLNNFNLDGNDELNLVSDVRNTYLRSAGQRPFFFFKKKGYLRPKIWKFSDISRIIEPPYIFQDKKKSKKGFNSGRKKR